MFVPRKGFYKSYSSDMNIFILLREAMMTPEDFTKCIREEILESNLKYYREVIEHPPSVVSDEYYQQVLSLYSQLNDVQKGIVLRLIRQTMIDTISNILGVLDGSVILNQYREDFSLTYADEGLKLNGDLLDFFLASIELHQDVNL